MTAREYLSEVQRLQTVIEQKQERIKEIRESVSTVRAVRFDLEKVQGGGLFLFLGFLPQLQGDNVFSIFKHCGKFIIFKDKTFPVLDKL